jgi:RNA polymerase sigma factor (sigma-70 family)
MMKPIFMIKIFTNSEYDLAKALVRKDSKAYELFYNQYSSKILAICCRYISDRMMAEDLMVESIMKIFDKVGQFEFKGSFEGWVKRIIVNEALMFLRTKKYTMVEAEAADVANVNVDLSDNLDTEDLVNTINELPVGYRTVFNLYAIEGYSHSEIAEMLNISEGTSKSQLSRARAILQEKIKKKELIELENIH